MRRGSSVFLRTTSADGLAEDLRRRWVREDADEYFPFLRGFTLTELLVVVVVLAILISTAAVSYHRRRTGIEKKTAVAQVQAIVAAEKSYYLSTDAFVGSANTAETNTRLGLLIQDSFFRNYRVTTGGGTFNVLVDAKDAAYTFDANATQVSCVGTGC